jgi:hypothetical protein
MCLYFFAQTTVMRSVIMHTTTDPAMSSSSSGPPDAHVAGANRVPPQPRRKYDKQKATGAAIALAEGAIQPGNCADVAVAAETVCGIVGKSTWTKKNSTTKEGRRTLHLRCMSEKPAKKGAKSPGRCQFECSCVEGDKLTPPGQVRIIKYVSHHGCSQGQSRQRAVSLSVRRAQSKTIDAFVPTANRRGGNMAQLQQMLQQQDGIHMKKGQVYNALQGESSDVCTHLAHYRMIHGWIAFMKRKDPHGTYVIETDWLDGVAHFRYLFAAPSATQKVRCVNCVCLPTVQPPLSDTHCYTCPRGHI